MPNHYQSANSGSARPEEPLGRVEVQGVAGSALGPQRVQSLDLVDTDESWRPRRPAPPKGEKLSAPGLHVGTRDVALLRRAMLGETGDGNRGVELLERAIEIAEDEAFA